MGTLKSGLAVDGSSAILFRMKRDVQELMVADYCCTAEEQMQSGDIAGAQKSLDLASRIDADNLEIKRMMDCVKPNFEEKEAPSSSKACPPLSDLYKEEGDEQYKAANFKGAIEFYTKCIDTLQTEGEGKSEVAIKAYSNRAACHLQISNFSNTVEDCTAVLEAEPDNVKALIRRAQALEGLALQDIATALSLPLEKIDKKNFDRCTLVKHRLKTID
eukprot:4687388-Ditylum_brightwellii.AAC.1